MPRNANLLDLNGCIAADRLYRHFDWERGHQATCNFMSWSSSLLFLIQYAFFRYTRWQHKSFDDIRLLIVDTRKLPKGTFAKDMDLLEELNTGCKCRFHKRLNGFLKLRNGRYYFGEYITQGTLDIFDGEGIQVNFQRMMNLGLDELLPNELKHEENWEDWPRTVVSARGSFCDPNDIPLASEDEFHAAITIANDLFGGPWSVPIAAMLLGLKPRQRNDPVIIDGFIARYGGEHPLTTGVFAVC
jgi:hypothetical protein